MSVIFIILIAMIGLPVFSAVRAALQGSGSTESRIDKGIELYKDRLPIKMDQYITLTNIEREEKRVTYDYEVKVEPEKLLRMRQYFQKKAQFDYCYSDNFLTYQTQSIVMVERFKSVGDQEFAFQVEATGKSCQSVERKADGYIMTIDVGAKRNLDVEYLEFFLPIEVSESMSIVSLTPQPHGMVEYNALGENLVGIAESVGREILNEFCDQDQSERLNIYVKPNDKEDPILIYELSDDVCKSRLPTYTYVSESDLRSLKVMKEYSSRR
ncbi:MAG: hypothetical protein ABJN52_13080 [Litorimonas sp.]